MKRDIHKEMDERLRGARLQAAYGGADAAYRDGIHAVIDGLDERARVRRPAARTVVLAAVLVAVCAGAAVAIVRHFGVLDTLGGEAIMPAGIIEAVQTEFTAEGGEMERMTMRVRDAVSDGRMLFVAVEVKTKDPDVALLSTHDFFDWTDADALAYMQFDRKEGEMPHFDQFAEQQQALYVSGIPSVLVTRGEGGTNLNPVYGATLRYEGKDALVVTVMIDLSRLEDPQEALRLEIGMAENTLAAPVSYAHFNDVMEGRVDGPVFEFDYADSAVLAVDVRAGSMQTQMARADGPVTIGAITLTDFIVETTPLATYVHTVRQIDPDHEGPGYRLEFAGEDGVPYELVTNGMMGAAYGPNAPAQDPTAQGVPRDDVFLARDGGQVPKALIVRGIPSEEGVEPIEVRVPLRME